MLENDVAKNDVVGVVGVACWEAWRGRRRARLHFNIHLTHARDIDVAKNFLISMPCFLRLVREVA